MTAPSQLRPNAALWGLFSAAVFSVPIAIVVGLFDREGSSGFGAVTVLKLTLLLLSAAFAGYAAGRTAGTGYAVNGAVAGAATFLVVQVVYSIAKGSFSNPVALLYALFLGACLGTLGGIFAGRQTSPGSPAHTDEPDSEEHDR